MPGYYFQSVLYHPLQNLCLVKKLLLTNLVNIRSVNV